MATSDLSIAVAAEGAMTVDDTLDCHAVADPILTLSRPLAGPLLSTRGTSAGMAVSGREGLSTAHPRAGLPPRPRLSTAHPKGGLSPGGGLSSAQPRGGLRSAVLARAAAPGVRGAADSLEPRLEPRKRRVGPREASRGVVGAPAGMWRGEGGPRGMWSGDPTLSSGESREVCMNGERGGE